MIADAPSLPEIQTVEETSTVPVIELTTAQRLRRQAVLDVWPEELITSTPLDDGKYCTVGYLAHFAGVPDDELAGGGTLPRFWELLSSFYGFQAYEITHYMDLNDRTTTKEFRLIDMGVPELARQNRAKRMRRWIARQWKQFEGGSHSGR